MPSEQEEHLERARELWHRFQFHIYVGLGMILAAIIGFTVSHSASQGNRDFANEQLYLLMSSVDAEERDEAVAAYEAMLEDGDFAELDYLGGFVLASLHYASGEYEEAEAVLQPALEGSEDVGIRKLAALRIAEVRIASGDTDGAVALLEEHKPRSGQLLVLYDERMGDAEFTAGNVAKAKAAYERALRQALEEGLELYVPILNIKLSTLLSDVDAARQVRLEEEAAVDEFREAVEEALEEGEDDDEDSEEEDEDDEDSQ